MRVIALKWRRVWNAWGLTHIIEIVKWNIVSDSKCVLCNEVRGKLGSFTPAVLMLFCLESLDYIWALEPSYFLLALWSSGWLNGWRIQIFIDWCLRVKKRLCLRSDNALFCRYAQVSIAQQADQSNCRKVPRQVCQVVDVADNWGTLAEMVWKGWFGYKTKSCYGRLL